MGNCTSAVLQKKGASAKEDKQASSKSTNEVTYACIDHSKARGTKLSRPADDYTCDYTTVVIPPTTQIPSECSSGDGCDNDYVPMN